MLYLCIFIFVLLSTYQFDFAKGRKNKWLVYWIIYFVFICLSGFRYHIGIDTLFYEQSWNLYPDFWDFNWFDNIEKFKGNPQTERYQLGWILYVMLIQSVSKEFFLCQLVNAILINMAVFRLVKKYSSHPFTVIFIYCCTFTFIEFNFELMRETVAVAIFLFAGIDYYLSRKWVKYYLVVICSFFFHPSSIMMFALPFVRNFHLKTWQYVILFAVPGMLIGLGGRLLLGDILNILFGETAYVTEYYAGGQEHSINYFLMYAFRPTALLLLYLLFNKYIVQKEFVPIFFFSIFFMYVGALIYTAARFTNYIVIVDYILIGNILYFLAIKFRTVLVIPIYLAMVFIPNFYQYATGPTGAARHYPYRSIFFKDPTPRQRTMEKDALQGVRG